MHKLISLILAFVLLGTLFGATLAEKAERFEGRIIVSDGVKLDLSGIVINVYSATLAYEDNKLGLCRYDETFAFSIETKTDGSFSFEKPSTYCLLSIDINSLPYDMGITKQTTFYFPEKNNDEYVLARIADIEVDYDITQPLGNETIRILDAEGNTISAPYSVRYSNTKTIKDALLNGYGTAFEIIVTAGNTEKAFPVSIDGAKYTAIERADIAYRFGTITVEEKILLYIDALVNNTHGLTCLTSLYEDIEEFARENPKSEVCVRLAELRSGEKSGFDYKPDYGTEATVSDNFFVIHYDSELLSLSKAEDVLDVYNDIEDYFTSYGFQAPLTISLDSKFHVFIDTYGNGSEVYGLTSGYEWPTSTTTAAYIVLRGLTDLTNLSTGVQPRAALAHEFFHAIQWSYNDERSGRTFMSEAGASWAGVNFSGDGGHISGSVNTFLSQPDTSLTSTSGSHDYGALLYPQFISQTCGGPSTLRRIYQSYAQGYSLSTAITNGISAAGYNYTYYTAYLGCAAYCSYPTFYSCYAQSWNPSAATVSDTEMQDLGSFYSWPNTLSNTMSSKYYRFTPDFTVRRKLTVTVELDSIPTGTEYMQLVFQTSGGSVFRAINEFSADMSTYTLDYFGSLYTSAFCVVSRTSGWTATYSVSVNIEYP